MDRKLGEIPIMVKTNKCHLHGMTTKQLVQHGEEPFEFGGFFIANGNEKVGQFSKLPAFLEFTNTDPFAAWFVVIGDATSDRIRDVREKPLPSEEGTPYNVFRTFTFQPRPEPGLGRLVCAVFARQRLGCGVVKPEITVRHI